MAAIEDPNLPAGWEAYDDGSGYPYYYNLTTQESTYDYPTAPAAGYEGAAGAGADAGATAADAGGGGGGGGGAAAAEEEWPRWSKVLDPPSASYYYYENYTGECVWDRPDDYLSPREEGGSFGMHVLFLQ